MIVPKVARTRRCDLCAYFERPEIRDKDVNAVFLEEVLKAGDELIFAPSNEVGLRICPICMRNLASMTKRGSGK